MSKYGSKKIDIGGIIFDSKIEADYFFHLKQLAVSGLVKDYRLQPVYELQPKFVYKGKTIQPIKYVADFEVIDDKGITVIDIKGMPTHDALIKRKMFMYKYPELKLIRLQKYQNEWVDYFENAKRRSKNRREKKANKL